MKPATSFAVLGAAAVGVAGILFFGSRRQLSYCERLEMWTKRKRAASEELAACIIRYKAEAKRAAQQNAVIGAFVGALMLAASDGDIRKAIKAGKSAQNIRNQIAGAIPGCEDVARRTEEEFDWLIAEAAALELPLDADDDEWNQFLREKCRRVWIAEDARRRSHTYWLCRQQGLITDENCLNPSGEPLFRYGPLDAQRDGMGYATRAFLRGDALYLSKTPDGKAPAPTFTRPPSGGVSTKKG